MKWKKHFDRTVYETTLRDADMDLDAKIETAELLPPYANEKGEALEYGVFLELTIPMESKASWLNGSIIVRKRFLFKDKSEALKAHIRILELIANGKIMEYLKETTMKGVLDKEKLVRDLGLREG